MPLALPIGQLTELSKGKVGAKAFCIVSLSTVQSPCHFHHT